MSFMQQSDKLLLLGSELEELAIEDLMQVRPLFFWTTNPPRAQLPDRGTRAPGRCGRRWSSGSG